MKAYTLSFNNGSIVSYCVAESMSEAVNKFVSTYKPEYQDVMRKFIAACTTESNDAITGDKND